MEERRLHMYQRSMSLPISSWRLPFLPTVVERDGGEEEATLDEEMEKVFSETSLEGKFDLATVTHEDLSPHSRRFSENDYSFHREKTYPHMHAPLKAIHPKRKRAISCRPPAEGDTEGTAMLRKNSQGGTDSDTGPSVSVPIAGGSLVISSPDDGSTAEELPLSESTEPIISERASAFDGSILSPDRRVQFDIGSPDTEDGKSPEQTAAEEQEERRIRRDEDREDKKKRRRHHHHHYRKTSLLEDPGWRKRSGAEALPRRMSEAVLEETASLHELDQDQLVSHRFDISKGKRRFSVKPKDASRKDSAPLVGQKKMFDHSPHEVFVQLDELFTNGIEREWKETARWIKYEEDVEEGAERWGRPHVAPLSFHSLLNLRRCLETGVILLDLEERELPGVVYRVVETMATDELITEGDKATVMRALLLRHRHVSENDKRFSFNVRRNTTSYTSLQSLAYEEHGSQYELRADNNNLNDDLRKVKLVPSASALDKVSGNLLQPPLLNHHTSIDMKEETYLSSTEDLARRSAKESILKRIPIGAEATTVLVGAVDFLEQPTIAFVRLAEGILIPSITEVPIPVRFMFILLGPCEADLDYHEIGRSISTLMSNPEFHCIAYKATVRKELLSAINEFLNASIVLPPGDWERQALLPFHELKAKTEAIKRRQSRAQSAVDQISQKEAAKKKALLGDGGDGKDKKDDPLQRTGRPWGGLIKDLKRRYPHYWSDLIEGLNGQCVAAAIFMYFAALSGAITFGGLMADKTNNLVGISETLVATSFAGIFFALLSGQPLVIIGATGPLLLFDESLYTFCVQNEINYLTMRVFIGIWLLIIALVISFFEGSVFVKLFTRFTEEIFASLISLLYIVESVTKMFLVFHQHPLMTLEEYCAIANESQYSVQTQPGIERLPENDTLTNSTLARELRSLVNETSVVLMGPSTNTSVPTNTSVSTNTTRLVVAHLAPANEPNTALFCTILALGTFFIAYYLRHFRNSKFLGRSARRALGDFGVPIAIIVMVFLDYITPGTYTDKLKVPEGLSPSNPEVRGWVIPPSVGIPIWGAFAAVVPALLVYILIFMETHISELIIDKKERKLKKGSGFHVDIVLICLLNVGCGFIGAPWMCAATVRSVTHVAAVTVMSRTHAPGEKPHIIEVKEQRLSALLVSTLIGLSVLMSPLLRLVPMAVLFGVFLYMGISSINGIQFFERCRLFFMPVKHHPRVAYVRRVQTLKMHLFTMIQLMCLVILWVVKSSQISLAFPFFLILMVPLRAQMRYIFSPMELRALDSDEPDNVDEEEPDFYHEALLPG
ncbi:band 3 anion transport protein isoform X3 [Halyomorpha halys]|uniref:band 3 anion transport protein isoform X3 n=1 Tax=Halyomorpha halys TaxID=286706 RepID=UPI0006D4EF4D|nr:band 3 anion transport protein isoform X3 [Halyomorpha halys]